ncbi:MAG: hypothetical protein K2L32_04600 [Muribaculaceae bacterium]|nr:hypothetical protein [Muribaculaceae bacterium]
MNRICAIYMLGAALAAGLWSCSSGSDEPLVAEADYVRLSVPEAIIEVSPEGGDVVIGFTSNKDWRAETPGANGYVNGVLQQDGGSAGVNEVIFTATPNTGMTARQTNVRISAGRASAEVSLRQEVLPIDLPDEAQVREYLMRLFDDTDGPNWRFKGRWGSDLPLSQWGSEVKYENGRLELNLAEHYLKGKIDLSGCKALVSIKCSVNQISELDLSDCPLLTYVDCTNTGLERIDLSGCHSLRRLSVPFNNLTHIDIGWSKTLSELYVHNCRLESLDLSQCVSLQTLSCHTNCLQTLDVPQRRMLVDVFCYGNDLTRLELGGSPQLQVLNCGENGISELNVRGCPRLRWIYCHDNRLADLDVTDQKGSLAHYYCFSNNLTRLDLTGYSELSELHCSDNDICELLVGGCRRLGWLYCSYNRLETLDLSTIDPDLTRLDISFNRLREIDLDPFIRLVHLWCQGNRIGGEIPERFDRLEDFEHDARYEYMPSSGTYIDRGYGWWYPGEPESFRHTR